MIVEGNMQNLKTVAELAACMWTHHEADELLWEFQEIVSGGRGQFFLAYEGDEPVGFAQCQLRTDYVEGTKSSPAGYLEGIYVKETHRRKGWARALLAACETWAGAQGCEEFASDCELDNTDSLGFHLHMGFEEANRIICFARKL